MRFSTVMVWSWAVTSLRFFGRLARLMSEHIYMMRGGGGEGGQRKGREGGSLFLHPRNRSGGVLRLCRRGYSVIIRSDGRGSTGSDIEEGSHGWGLEPEYLYTNIQIYTTISVDVDGGCVNA